jgi:hypothetical protein
MGASVLNSPKAEMAALEKFKRQIGFSTKAKGCRARARLSSLNSWHRGTSPSGSHGLLGELVGSHGITTG